MRATIKHAKKPVTVVLTLELSEQEARDHVAGLASLTRFRSERNLIPPRGALHELSQTVAKAIIRAGFSS